MKTDPHIGLACSEEFAELCALATTGTLTVEESARLEKHVAACERCREVLAEYRALASGGMAKLGAEMFFAETPGEIEPAWPHAEAKSQLLKRLQAGEPATREALHTGEKLPVERGWGELSPRRTPVLAVGIAAILVLGLTVGYRFGEKSPTPGEGRQVSGAVMSIEQKLRAVEAERDSLNAELTTSSKSMRALTERAERGEAALLELRAQKASLEANAQQMSASNKGQTDSFASLASERAALERRLADTEQTLKNVQQNLNALEDERRKAQLRTASLETTIDELSSKLRERDETAKRDEEFLASDRDVRELMGARQLYIADVFDVDQNGKKRSSFGRVFYTKGKSLIFYAFDLDQQPAYRDAKAPASKTFEVWGTGGQDNSKPIGLGVFYMDSEANRRWVFKSDDPKILAQVNAVFVTVESKDSGRKPSGKPFLYAYLRTAPTNHP